MRGVTNTIGLIAVLDNLSASFIIKLVGDEKLLSGRIVNDKILFNKSKLNITLELDIRDIR
jgi:hypothetical protein